MKTIYEAILNRKTNTSEIAEHHYIKQQLFPDEFDSSIWGEGSLYMGRRIPLYERKYLGIRL